MDRDQGTERNLGRFEFEVPVKQDIQQSAVTHSGAEGVGDGYL